MRDKYMIYSIHHKNENFLVYKNEVLTPIMAGPRPEKGRTDILLYDDMKDNIEYLHKTFSEFTATY